MLADDIAVCRVLRAALKEKSHDALCETISAAQRFELSQNFAAAATQIARTNPSAFRGAVGACRLPAPVCWFEVANTFRADFNGGLEYAESLNSSGVGRVGVLLEQLTDCGLCYNMHLFFGSDSGVVCPSTLTLGVDLRANSEMRAVREHRGLTRDVTLASLAWRYSGDSLEAAADIEEMTIPFANRFTEDMVKTIYSGPGLSGRSSAEKDAAMVEAETKNWSGELLFWLSALALINTRNVGKTIAAHSLDKLNKRRVAAGRIPLLSYSTCRLDQTGSREGLRAGVVGHGQRRAHFMRGHFKMRKTGVFWWRPSMRGTAGLGLHLKKYDVRHHP